MMSPIQMPGISKTFTVMAKIRLVAKTPKSIRVRRVRKLGGRISWVVRIGSMGII